MAIGIFVKHRNTLNLTVRPELVEGGTVKPLMLRSFGSQLMTQHERLNATIHHAHCYGECQSKYQYLAEQDINTTHWTTLTPQAPFYLFVPQDTDLLPEYQAGWKVTEMMPVNSVGIVTARDSLTIHDSPNAVIETINDFAKLGSEEARDKYNLGKDARDWKVELAQKDISI